MSTPKRTIAIDPGKSGGIAIKYPDKSISIQGMPKTETEVVAVLLEHVEQAKIDREEVVLVIEKVGGFVGKGQPGSSMFTFGRGAGVIIGAAIALRIPIVEITPQQWMKGLGLGTKGKRTPAQWKRHLIDQAKKRHPTLLNVNANTADALLLLNYVDP
jgi:hypothetical protein